jgi:hypothetical protein
MKTRCPYRPWLKNVHVRRAYLIFFGMPATLFVIVPAVTMVKILNDLVEAFGEIYKGIADPESYD